MELKIDSKKTALVVIDLQKGIASMGRQLAPHSADEVIGMACNTPCFYRKIL